MAGTETRVGSKESVMPQSKKPKPTKSKPNKKEILKKRRHKIERTDDKPADGELWIEELGKVVGGHCRGCRGCRDL
jgi:hypothetical protein